MKARRFVSVAAAGACVLLGGMLITSPRAPQALGEQHEVELANGKKVQGALLRMEEASYLVQTDRDCLLLKAGEVRNVDGHALSAKSGNAGDRVPRRHETFEVIRPGGEIELHSILVVRNDGTSVITKTDWGMAAHEIDQIPNTRVVDAYGNELPLGVMDDPAIQGKRIHVDFPRPVLPGEELRLTMIVRSWGTVQRDGAVWVYKMAGDYPDDRLVTRSILLPAGARVESAQPEPLHVLSVGTDGQPLVIWRRYFLRGERVPWEVRYTL